MPILWTVKDIVQQLQLKPSTVYAWAAQGKIPTLKINGVIRFDRKEIETWLKSSQLRVELRPNPADLRRRSTRDDVDSLIETAKRAVYTTGGETRPIASPNGKEA